MKKKECHEHLPLLKTAKQRKYWSAIVALGEAFMSQFLCCKYYINALDVATMISSFSKLFRVNLYFLGFVDYTGYRKTAERANYLKKLESRNTYLISFKNCKTNLEKSSRWRRCYFRSIHARDEILCFMLCEY